MSTGPRTQAAFIQGNQSTIEHDTSHSALFYLFQEVSKLSSPIHTSFLDTNSPSTWLRDTSRQGHFIAKKEEQDANPFEISNNSCQHSLSCMSPFNQVKKIKEECHDSKATTLVEPHCKSNSPWKVLSLINLQCERLLQQKDVDEPDSGSLLSTTKLDHSVDKPSTSTTDVTDQGIGGDCLTVEYTLRPSHLIKERQEIPSCVSLVENVRGDCSKAARSFNAESCAKDSKVSSCVIQNQNAEKADTISVFHNSQLEWNQEFRNDSFASAEDILHLPFSVNISSQTHVPYAYFNAQLTVNSNEDACVVLSKPALTLDHNSNFALNTEPPCDNQLPPPSSVLPSVQSVSFLLDTSETYQSFTKQDDKNAVSKSQRTPAHSEEKGPSVPQQKTSTNPSSATLNPEPRSVLKEEIAAPSTQQWRTKTPRKQPHPRRSANIQDPYFQGVTFRMDTELDANREQCRLLITSQYSKELHMRMKKPRLRSRASQKSIKASSSDEESELTTNVSKGKVCASCCTRKTPMWRDAEDGTPLCNACGIRYKKYRVRCVSCWHIPRKEGNSNSCCLKCGNFVRLTSAQRKHTT